MSESENTLYYRVVVEGSFWTPNNRLEITNWCNDNVGEYGVDWGRIGGNIYVFHDELIALLFKIKYGSRSS